MCVVANESALLVEHPRDLVPAHRLEGIGVEPLTPEHVGEFREQVEGKSSAVGVLGGSNVQPHDLGDEVHTLPVQPQVHTECVIRSSPAALEVGRQQLQPVGWRKLSQRWPAMWSSKSLPRNLVRLRSPLRHSRALGRAMSHRIVAFQRIPRFSSADQLATLKPVDGTRCDLGALEYEALIRA